MRTCIWFQEILSSVTLSIQDILRPFTFDFAFSICSSIIDLEHLTVGTFGCTEEHAEISNE